MQKKTIFLMFLVIILIAISVLLAYNPTRPAVINSGIGVGTMILEGINSIAMSTWFVKYGWAILIGGGLFTGIFLTAMYYRGKLRIWRYGATKASEITAARQPAPAPTPTPLATPPVAVAPQPVEEKAEAKT